MKHGTRMEDRRKLQARDDRKCEPIGTVWAEMTELCWRDHQQTGNQQLWACDPLLRVCVLKSATQPVSGLKCASVELTAGFMRL